MDAATLSYPIVDTNQSAVYGAVTELSVEPAEGQRFYGQDAQYDGFQPLYQDNGDGTITDLVTGLMWQKTPTLNISYADALAGADTATTGGYDDWRLPTIKELYSLMDFSGDTGWDAASSTPYIDDSVFDFSYGDTAAGERFIDAQYWSSTEYVGTTMNGNTTTFGLNLADGRIKGYPNTMKLGEALYVRGDTNYGENQFVDNGNGTISDAATGLTWTATDSGMAMSWEDALAWAGDLVYAGHDDWRLPNAKELQSIVDYSRAPDPTDPTADNTGAAIDPLFTLTNIGTSADPDYPYLWTSTTHVEHGIGDSAVYIAFGEALGWMEFPWSSSPTLMDVHGAGAQRSDFKTGDADDYPYGHGPQGDVVRIENFAIAVRDTDESASGLSGDTTFAGDRADYAFGWIDGGCVVRNSESGTETGIAEGAWLTFDDMTVFAGADPGAVTSPEAVPVAQVEGTGTTTTNCFLLSRAASAADRAITFQFSTLDEQGTATAGEDYLATSGSVTLDVGQTAVAIEVRLVADDVAEGDETLFLHVWTEGEDGALVSLTAVHTIVDDDGLALA